MFGDALSLQNSIIRNYGQGITYQGLIILILLAMFNYILVLLAGKRSSVLYILIFSSVIFALLHCRHVLMLSST